VVPQRFFTHGQNAQGDRHVCASRTRFIPDELLGPFERVAWPEAEPELAARGASKACGSISRLACAAYGAEREESPEIAHKPFLVDDARQPLIDEVDRIRARKEPKGE
jgi:hypothetical protein